MSVAHWALLATAAGSEAELVATDRTLWANSGQSLLKAQNDNASLTTMVY